MVRPVDVYIYLPSLYMYMAYKKAHINTYARMECTQLVDHKYLYTRPDYIYYVD